MSEAQIGVLKMCGKGTWTAHELAAFVNRHRSSVHDVAMTMPALITPGFDLTAAGRVALAAIDA